MLVENIELLIEMKKVEFLDILINLKLFKFSISIVESIFKLQNNQLFNLINNNKHFRNYICKYKLKLLYLINLKSKNIRNLINKDIETIEMKILSFHNTNQLLQKITKFQLNTLDFDKLIKNTTPNNIHKLVNFTFKMYDKFKDKSILLKFLKVDKLNNKTIELIFEYIIEHKIQIDLTSIIEDYMNQEVKFVIIKKFINKLPSKISFSIIGTKLSTLISKVHYFIKDQIFIIDDEENYKKKKQFRKMRNYTRNLHSILNLQNCEEISKLEYNEIWKKITTFHTFLEDYLKKLKEHTPIPNESFYFNYEYNSLKKIINKIVSLLVKFNFLEKIILNFLFPITSDELHNKETCPICMDCNTIEESQKLKCGHIYHIKCIIQCFKTPNLDIWRKEEFTLNCPYCRQSVLI